MLDIIYPSVIPGPPRPSRILTPQRFSRHQGQERHVVPGGGAILLQVMVGDRLTLVNDEGGQPVELVAAAKDGRVDAGLLGLAANSTAEGLKAMLAAGEASLGRLRQGAYAAGDRSGAGGHRAGVQRRDSGGDAGRSDGA
jgi:aminomethyltransferase